MSFSKLKKKSIGKIIGWSVLIIPPLLILIALSINKVHHSYPLAKALPVSQGTKTRAFWYDVDSNKLKQLKEENKIVDFVFNADGKNAVVSDGEYWCSIYFNTRSTDALSEIYVYQSSGESNKTVMKFYTVGTNVRGVYDYGELNKSQIDEISKKVLKLYNQFIKDYENI